MESNFCFHCGDVCPSESIIEDGHPFCCQGCRQVYLLLNENNLCSYYDFSKTPGIKAKGRFISENFAFLDDEHIINDLVSFKSEERIHVMFDLPQVHCSSCVYLLENLHRINSGILQSNLNFQRKEIFIAFSPKDISLRGVVELLTFIGYEPAISLKSKTKKRVKPVRRKEIFRIAVAGFCFSNIMMLSFPEYLSSGNILEGGFKEAFSWLIFALSLPVLIFGAGGIFKSAFKGLRHKDINIDVPIALAIVITFGRSYYEIISGTGAGYLDSGTGIIFYMLVGRWFQSKTNEALSFDRDYRSYFPLGVTVSSQGKEDNIPVTRLKHGDKVVLRMGEMLPADAILKSPVAEFDYSFVTGENKPVILKSGALVYAGCRQLGGRIELEVVKEPSRSYITELWNNDVFSEGKRQRTSFVHPWSRYFTVVLLSIATATAIYWYNIDASKLFPAVTAVLIVACPCSLLLSATFTFGNMLRYFGRAKLFLKNAGVIEQMAAVNTIVLDKTGTVTEVEHNRVQYNGVELYPFEKRYVKQLVGQSAHVLSRSIFDSLDETIDKNDNLFEFKELPGHGIEAVIDNQKIRMGAYKFVFDDAALSDENDKNGSRVYVKMGDSTKGFYEFKNMYRKGFKRMVWSLIRKGYEVHLLSGDNDAEKKRLNKYFDGKLEMVFDVTPLGKLEYIKKLQKRGRKVLMVGDGLNDAGALKQADVSIAVSDQSARFTPASDGILDGSAVRKLSSFLHYARGAKKLIAIGFVLSILYNVVGLTFAVTANLSPLVAAILMPASSLSLIGLAAGLTYWYAKTKSKLR